MSRFQDLIAAGPGVRLASVAALGLPEFSGISFVSKILAFLNPDHYCVLDKQLLKLAESPGDKSLHRVSAGTQIPITAGNERAYDGWRAECADISERYFRGRRRVVDVERGFFQLVQDKQVVLAQDLYRAV
ncbi:MAG: hypothetical protein AB7Q29_13450 [Vicinamibacterales bacterium]